MTVPVSIYIPCYNIHKHLQRCVQSVLNQTYPVLEILLIDDASTDDTPKLAQALAAAHPDRIRVITQPSNQGLAAARNLGIEQAQATLAGALDADTCPCSTWLATLVQQMQENEKLGLIGGPLIESEIHGLADRWRKTVMSQDWSPLPRTDIPFVFGHSHLVRKEAVLKVGGYDPSMRTNGEDHDISQKLLQANYQLAYDPQAKVTHHRTDTVGTILNTYWRYWLFGNGLNKSRPGFFMSIRRCLGFIVTQTRRVLTTRTTLYKPDLLAVDFLLICYMMYRQWRWYFIGK